MKAEEIMIGDLVQVPSELNRVKRIRSTFDLDSAVLYKPIPLTAEGLEKNGFTCDDNVAKLTYRDDSKNVLWSAKYSFFTGVIEVANKITDEKIKARCYSIHELQHIFRLIDIDKEIVIE